MKALSDSSASHGFPVTGPLKINVTPGSIIHSSSISNSSKNSKSDNQVKLKINFITILNI